MKAIIAVSNNGGRNLLFVVPSSFDTQAWAQSRRDALQLLQITRLIEDQITMAHFMGVVNGMGGMVSRLGNTSSGLFVRACSWQGAVFVTLYERNGIDYAHVELAPHNGVGISRVLFDGPISGKETIA